MKVFHLIATLGYGGAEVFLSSLLTHLKRRGVDVAVVSMYDDMPLLGRLTTDGIPVHSLGHQGTVYSLRSMARSYRMLRDLFTRERPDVVHSHLYLPDLMSRLATPRSCALITTLHGKDQWWTERNRVRAIGKTWVDRSTGGFRDVRFVSVSEDVRSEASLALRISPNRHRVIYNGVDLARFPVVKRPQGGQPTLVQVGRFYPEKGHATALNAFALLQESFPSLRLVLVGEGPLRFTLESQARSLNILDAVTFAGTQADVGFQLGAADIFWMPSEREGLGMACLEAMASGLPVVATAVGGLQEVVSDGETGFLVPRGGYQELGSRTALLLQDREFSRRLGMNGRRRVEKLFAIETTAARYHESYEDLLSGRW
jgi:glycosyltransferase involved in cell wall biosynthesis